VGGVADGSPTTAPPRISVALVTRNRPESLERTLRSLRAQDVQPFEVVLSDDSDAEQAPRSREIATRYECRYVTGPRRGLYANRNHSALACRGTHVRTMDDDHEFPDGHMQACMRAVERRPEAVWIIGECLPGHEGTAEPWRCPPQLHPRGYSVEPLPGERMWAVADGASIYPREIFERGLRFYERFLFGASYLEWGSRLHWLGYEILHLEDTFVIHHYDPDARSFSDTRVLRASTVFAGLCHSFIYQPTVRNRLLTLLQFPVTVARFRTTGVRACLDAVSAFREQREKSLHLPGAEVIRSPARGSGRP
jgi:glycosyltransferase involved in cell wall biosynthesis